MTTEKQKHTELPWYCSRGNPRLITFEKGPAIAECVGETYVDPEANAEFIVRACNSYYDLLEACEIALHCCPPNTPQANKIYAAIQKATL